MQQIVECKRKPPHMRLKCQRLRLLPGEVLIREVPVFGRLEIDWSRKVELLDDDAWPHIEILSDDLDQLVRGLARGTIGIDKH